MPRPCVPYNPLSFLALFIVLFSLPACPEPSTHHDGFVESSTEGGGEKTEPPTDTTPEESAIPEESVNPDPLLVYFRIQV